MIQKVKDALKANKEREKSRCDLSDIVARVRAQVDAELAEKERKEREAALAGKNKED